MTLSKDSMTKAQQRILGFLVATGGNENSGSTAREISSGTGLSYNAVYVALRDDGIPGVLKCKWHTNTGAAQYYINPALMKEQMPVALQGHKTILDSDEWAAVPEFIFGELSLTIDKMPAGIDRLEELAKTALAIDPDDKEIWHKWAIAGQTIAILALRLAGNK